MPVMNGGRYFRLALDSALAQTYANLEIIVVNDGSTDAGETERIARSGGDRVRYIHQANRGVAGALNTAIDHMTGDFFTWLSHDDLYLPHKTAAQVAFHRRLGRPDAILFSDYRTIDAAGDLLYLAALDHRRFVQSPMFPLYNALVNGCTIFIPAHVIKTFYPFDEQYRFVQDYDLWLKILQKHEFFHQPEVLVQYRIHPGQDTQKPGAAVEGDELFIRMLDARSETERVYMFGSSRKFFSEMAGFLDRTPFRQAAAYARERAAAAVGDDILVSVVLPFEGGSGAVDAAHSVLGQTHRTLELILAGPENAESRAVDSLVKDDPRVRRLRCAEGGATALDAAMEAARGTYIAFIRPPDRFHSEKLAVQLDSMASTGATVSHTSFELRDGAGAPVTRVAAGTFNGRVYPGIIADCPIALSTLMIHSAVFLGGFRFPKTAGPATDALAFTELAFRHPILGVDQPLSVVGGVSAAHAHDPSAALERIVALQEATASHPVHGRHSAELARLAEARDYLERLA